MLWTFFVGKEQVMEGEIFFFFFNYQLVFCIFVEAGDSIFIGNSRLGCYVCLTAVFSHYYYVGSEGKGHDFD